MAKKQDFMSKTSKQSKLGNVCPVCEATYTFIQKVGSSKAEKTNAWKFSTQNVKVCKCNEKEVYS